jgi:flavin-dependent dehydrogenase
MIIGGGPAGAATALTLRQRGIACTLLEASPSVAHKVGETLPPTALPILRTLQAEALLQQPAHLPCYGNSWLWGSPTVQEKNFMLTTQGHGWHLDRQVFETDLLALAQQKGAVLLMGHKLMQAHWHGDTQQWALDTKQAGESSTQHHHCRLVVDTSGRNSKLARCLGIPRNKYDGLTGTIGRFPLPMDGVPAQFTYTEATANGWWYAALTQGQQLVTAFMTDADLLPHSLQSLPAYWDALQQTRLIKTLFPLDYTPPSDTPLHTQAAGSSALAQVYGSGWLAVGDAAFAYDPISSYGITSALGSGIYAGHAIADHLLGHADALPAYRYVTAKAFADYLPLLGHQYALEQQWSAMPFWQRRQ